jgi:pimeloyl-ACP methyl ester carboxylesterase
MHGRLCLPSGVTNPTLEILVPGATYSGVYWDSPVVNGAYSYVQHANAAGYATLALDRISTGQSSRPLSVQLSSTGQAQVVHQVIGLARSAGLAGTPFSHIVLVGHSLGSMITVVEATTYHDVDGVILTGFSHGLAVPGVLNAYVAGLIPAVLDPAFGLGYDPGYLTTLAGQRERLFHASADVDPAVIAWDEQTKSVMTATEQADGMAISVVLNTTLQISVPVLLGNGSVDQFFCGATVDCSTDQTLAASESAYFSSAAQLSTTVLPGAGHNNALAANAGAFYAAANLWIATHFS